MTNTEVKVFEVVNRGGRPYGWMREDCNLIFTSKQHAIDEDYLCLKNPTIETLKYITFIKDYEYVIPSKEEKKAIAMAHIMYKKFGVVR